MSAEEPTVDATAVEDDKPTDIIVRENQDVFRVIDRCDEELVEREITGDLVETMAYEFSVSGKKVRGLSYSGVNAVVRTMNSRGIARITCPPYPRPQYADIVDEEGDQAWECEVYAVDEVAGGGAWGRASQKKGMKLRSGDVRPDTFAKTKALSKAQRNAKLALISEQLKAELLTLFTQGQIRTIQAGPQDPEEQVDHATGKDAEKVDVENRALLDELINTHGLRQTKADALFDGHRTLPQKRQLTGKLGKLIEQRQAVEAAKP
jgi:hypothetical protein